MTDDPHTLDSLPSVIPVFPLPGVILLPGASLPLNIFEPRYLKMVRDAVTGNGLIGMIQPSGDVAAAKPDLFTVGGVGTIADFSETDDDRILIRLKGLSRFRVAEELPVMTPYRQVRADWEAFADDPWGGKEAGPVNRDLLLDSLKEYLESKGLDADFKAIASAPDDVLVNTLSMIVPMPTQEKQALLEAGTISDRSALLENLLHMASQSNSTSGNSTAH
ncbi:MAG: LON peptidase substrate-binding domain-containing protein [Alphaproteobacteria bacterium]|nr:LON peptidase substrate-binding domain-containing protein [Alphaproteobacteria bacterium]